MFTELDYRILEFVLQSSDPVPSHQLAMACDVSVNTVRTEIDLLNQELDTHGICIRMKRSSGVSMEILDPTAARPWLHQMRDAVIRNKRLRRKYSERVYSMARIILCAKDGITVERLEQIFYVSRGTILADIKNVRALLQMFRLELLNRRGGHGFTVQGSEWLIRQCLLQLHKNYTVTADSGKTESLAHERSFRAMFFMDAPILPRTRRSFILTAPGTTNFRLCCREKFWHSTTLAFQSFIFQRSSICSCFVFPERVLQRKSRFLQHSRSS